MFAKAKLYLILAARILAAVLSAAIQIARIIKAAQAQAEANQAAV